MFKGYVGKFLETSIHHRKLTWIPKMVIFKGSYLFQTIIMGIHVSFRECNQNESPDGSTPDKQQCRRQVLFFGAVVCSFC